MEFNFFRTTFVDSNGIVTQIVHIASELKEVQTAMHLPDTFHLAEEIADLAHSCETALRILDEKYGIDLAEVKRFVANKNAERGYYS